MPCQHSLPRRIIVLGQYGAKQFAQNVVELQRNSGLRYKFLISRVSECRRAATSFEDESFDARWLTGVTATTGDYAGNVKTGLQRFSDAASRRRALEPKILGLCLSVCSLSVRERTHPESCSDHYRLLSHLTVLQHCGVSAPSELLFDLQSIVIRPHKASAASITGTRHVCSAETGNFKGPFGISEF
jgi:hypothetical protein